MGWAAWLARASRRLARSMCNYSVLLPCSVWAFAKDVVFREASKAHSLKGAELQAMSAKQYTLRCFLRATFAKHCILRRVLQAASAKHTLLMWLVLFYNGCGLMAFQAFLFVLLSVNWRSVLSCLGCARPCTETLWRFAIFSATGVCQRSRFAMFPRATYLPTLRFAMSSERQCTYKTPRCAERPASHSCQTPGFAMFPPSHIRQTLRFPVDIASCSDPCTQTRLPNIEYISPCWLMPWPPSRAAASRVALHICRFARIW